MLVEDQKLDAVVSLPGGVFKPYAGVSTAILLFTKTNSGGTDHVWFYDVEADGWSLDDKRTPLLSEDKLGCLPKVALTAEEHAKNNLPDILARWRERDDEERSARARHRVSACPRPTLLAQGYDLSLNRYKEVVHEEVDHRPPKEILADLVEAGSGDSAGDEGVGGDAEVNDIPPMVSLTDLAELNPTLPDLPEKDAVVSFVPMSAVDPETASVTRAEDRRFEEVSKGYTPFLDGDVLIAKITPCFENGKIAHARMPRRIGFGSTEFHVVRPRPGKADVRYLLHFLRQRHVRLDGEQKMTGSAGQRRVPEHFIAGLIVPAPALAEQRRIAKILDRAEALRGKRRAALAQLDNLTRSIFLDLFGDPELNPRNWKMLRLQDALSMPLRNGLSPSHAGKIVAKVLTLSAITGSGFDSTALKTSTFQSPPPPDQSVDLTIS